MPRVHEPTLPRLVLMQPPSVVQIECLRDLYEAETTEQAACGLTFENMTVINTILKGSTIIAKAPRPDTSVEAVRQLPPSMISDSCSVL